jgi:predicted GIY-YIG superfamily endonuclease
MLSGVARCAQHLRRHEGHVTQCLDCANLDQGNQGEDDEEPGGRAMTQKIYLIKHLDTGKGYVGITGDELGKRWYQHLHDKNGALYTALRAEGHRMTMELIEEVATREDALIKEQEYIHSLGTAQPDGWNRQFTAKPKPKPISKRWYRHAMPGIRYDNSGKANSVMGDIICPTCYNPNDDTEDGKNQHIDEVKTIKGKYLFNVKIYLFCETCYQIPGYENKPRNYIEFDTSHGCTTVSYVYHLEAKS